MNIQRAFPLFPVTVALLTLLIFLPAVRNDFVNWDDHANFLNNPDYRGLGWAQLQWMWTTHLGGRYIPLTWMTLGLDYTIWEMDPFGYHLTSILFHAVNAALFYFVALAILRTAMRGSSDAMRQRIPIGAFFTALIFALHPLRAESVAWATERRDVVCGMFYLLALLAYLRRFPDGSGHPARRKYYWVSLAFFAMAVLSKEITVTLPLVLLILDDYPLGRLSGGPARWFRTGEARKVWLEKLPFLVIALVDGALALYIGTQQNLTASLTAVNGFSRLAICIYGLAFYLRKTLAPLNLAALYALNTHRVDPRALPFQLSAVIVILVVTAAILFRRKIPGLWAACLAYAITLLPVLGILHNGMQITADRYSYLACLGWAILAGSGLLALWTGARRRVVALAAAFVVCGLSYLTWRQVRFWHDSETLWTHAIGIEDSAVAHDNLGMVFSTRGDLAGGLEQYRAALQIDPDHDNAHNNLGTSLLLLGEPEEALHEFQTALKINPKMASSQTGWGQVLMKQGKLDQAIEHFRLALKLNPAYKPAQQDLQRALELKSSSK